jgi:hypothetical protein
MQETELFLTSAAISSNPERVIYHNEAASERMAELEGGRDMSAVQ